MKKKTACREDLIFLVAHQFVWTVHLLAGITNRAIEPHTGLAEDYCGSIWCSIDAGSGRFMVTSSAVDDCLLEGRLHAEKKTEVNLSRPWNQQSMLTGRGRKRPPTG